MMYRIGDTPTYFRGLLGPRSIQMNRPIVKLSVDLQIINAINLKL